MSSEWNEKISSLQEFRRNSYLEVEEARGYIKTLGGSIWQYTYKQSVSGEDLWELFVNTIVIVFFFVRLLALFMFILMWIVVSTSFRSNWSFPSVEPLLETLFSGGIWQNFVWRNLIFWRIHLLWFEYFMKLNDEKISMSDLLYFHRYDYVLSFFLNAADISPRHIFVCFLFCGFIFLFVWFPYPKELLYSILLIVIGMVFGVMAPERLSPYVFKTKLMRVF